MKDRQQNGAAALTAEEHLWLHQKMERRAHELWLAGGCPREAALQNWAQAEREAWAVFKRIPPHEHAAKPAGAGRRWAGNGF